MKGCMAKFLSESKFEPSRVSLKVSIVCFEVSCLLLIWGLEYMNMMWNYEGCKARRELTDHHIFIEVCGSLNHFKIQQLINSATWEQPAPRASWQLCFPLVIIGQWRGHFLVGSPSLVLCTFPEERIVFHVLQAAQSTRSLWILSAKDAGGRSQVCTARVISRC